MTTMFHAKSTTDRPRPTRWAAAPTLLMALANAAVGPTASAKDVAPAIAWATSALGLAGFVAGFAILARSSWARTACAAIGALNAIGGLVALVQGRDGAPVGIVLGVAALGLAFVSSRKG